MIKLLSADFYRLKKDKTIWITAAAMFVLQIFMLIDRVKFNTQNSSENLLTLNDFFFEYMPLAGFLYAVFIALFVGKEYSEGTIRNKLIMGHKRQSIYLSSFITCLFGSLIIYLMLVIGGLIGMPFMGKWQGGADTFILYIIIGIFITASLSSILTAFAMLLSNRAVNAVVSIVMILLFMIAASIIYNGLAEPEFINEFVEITQDEGIVYGPEVANPAYVAGVQRKIYEFLLQFLPSGQGILMANGEISMPLLNIACSVIMTAVVNIIGIFAFKKKDLK